MPQLQQDEVLVEIPLGGGLKQDAAQAWVQAPAAGDLVNCMPDKEGRVVKVPGADNRSSGEMGASGNSVPNGLFTDGAVVGVNTSEGTWLYDDAAGSPGEVPTHELALRAAGIRSEPFTAADTSIWFPDSAVGGAYEAFAWQTDPNDDLPRGYLMIRHRDTRAIVYGPRALTGDVHTQYPQPRVISDGTHFLVLANRNASVQAGVIAWRIPIAGGSLSSAGTVNTASARPLLDVIFDSAISTSAIVAVAQNAASTYEVRRVSFAAPPVWNSTFTSISTAVNAAALASDGSKVVSAITVDTSRQVKTYEINVSGGSSTAGATFTANWTPGTVPAMQMRVAVARQDASNWAVFWSLVGAVPGTSAAGGGVRGTTEWRIVAGDPLADTTPAPSGSLQVHYIRNYVLASHAFRPTSRGAHVALAYLWTDAVDAVRDATELSNGGTNDSGSYTLQDHGFLVELATVTTIDDDSAEVSDLACAPIARFDHDMQYSWDSALSGGASAELQHCVPRWTLDADGSWRLATLRVADRRGSFTPTNSFTRAGAATQYVGAHVRYDPTPPPLRHVNSGRTVHFPGGWHAVYDGVQVAESTPFYMPERPEIQDYNSGSTTPAGVYAFKVVFFWEDARGNIHRTAPSRASRRWASTGAPANTGLAVSYNVPPLLTALAARHNRQVLVEVYRTPDLSVAGTAEVYERLYRGPVQAHATDPHMGTYSMTATAATYNTDGHGLYTDVGGDLGAEPPPALLDVATFAGRLVGIHADNPNQLWVTKLVQDGIAPEWHNVLTIPVPDADIDGAVALGALDDKLVVLTKRRILYVYGDGPDQTGAGGFAPPTEVADQVGASRPDGVIRTPAGIVVWTGPDGPWLLTPGMSVQPFGREVEDEIASSAFAWAATNPAAGLLHVGLADGTFLCWDWTRATWHTRTRSALTVHCLEIGSKMWRIRSDMALRRENAAATADPDGFTNQAYTSPWIRLDSSQGFQRVRWVLLGLASHGITNGRLKVSVGHDYQAGDSQTAIWYEAGGVSFDLTNMGRLLPAMHIKKQKCQSIRVRVYEESPDNSPGTYSTGTGFALERLTLQAKHKGGRYRLLKDAAKK